MKRYFAGLGAGAAIFSTTSAYADQPVDWEMRFQAPVTEIMHEIERFEIYTLWFIVPITLLVLVLLAYCLFKFSAKRNPVASRTSHNTTIEVIWTVAPIIILVLLAFPSFKLLRNQYTPPEDPAITIKTTGNQWNWDYEYQLGEETISFNQAMLQEVDAIKKAKPDTPDSEIPRIDLGKTDLAKYPRLLAVDNEVVVPVNVTTRLLVTSSAVIHAWTIPAFGVKTDAVPGRINEIWFKPQKEGLYYGQCSELCGKDHAFMPIAVRVVTQQQYDAWVETAKSNVKDATKALVAEIDGTTKVASAGN